MFFILIYAGNIMELMSNKITYTRLYEKTLRTVPIPKRLGFSSNFDGHFRIFLTALKSLIYPIVPFENLFYISQ